MTDDQIKRKVYGILKHGPFSGPDNSVFVSGGDGENIHIVIASQQFEDKCDSEREDMIRKILFCELTSEESSRIGRLIGYSPEDLKAFS